MSLPIRINNRLIALGYQLRRIEARVDQVMVEVEEAFLVDDLSGRWCGHFPINLSVMYSRRVGLPQASRQ